MQGVGQLGVRLRCMDSRELPNLTAIEKTKKVIGYDGCLSLPGMILQENFGPRMAFFEEIDSSIAAESSSASRTGQSRYVAMRHLSTADAALTRSLVNVPSKDKLFMDITEKPSRWQ